jgi:hypothetical protein
VRIRIVWGIRMERILLMVWLEGLVVRLGANKKIKDPFTFTYNNTDSFA